MNRIKSILTSMCIVLQISSAGMQTVLAEPLDLDLSSKTASMTPPATLGDKSVTIVVGGKQQVVDNQSLLTPAQRLAVWQILSTGDQSIKIGAHGNAVGGSFVISPWLSQNTSNLVIPKNVTSLDRVGNLNLSGNLTNSGTLKIVPDAVAASINAQNIFNNVGGLISSSVPLSVTAVGTVFNAGKIHSAGSLSIAGESIINVLSPGSASALCANGNINLITSNLVNSSLISSLNGSINLASQVEKMIVTNAGGTLKALRGNVSLNDLAFTGKTDFNLFGGDVLSQAFNIWAGCGVVNVDADDITGTVNIAAGVAHVLSSTSNLKLGSMIITGDPTYYNTGSITISGPINTSSNALAIIASRDIKAVSGASINTSSSGLNSGTLLLIAGAQFSPVGSTGTNTSGGGDISNTITVSGASATGGKIDLNVVGGVTINTAASGTGTINAGDVDMIAFAGTGSGSGSVNLTGSTITTGGVSSGVNFGAAGNVVVLAGAQSGNAITTGTINTLGNSGVGLGGHVLLIGATPSINSPLLVNNGVVTNNSNSIQLSDVQRTNITLGGSVTTNGSPLTVVAGRNVSLGGSITTNGSTSGRTPANIAILAGGSIVTTAFGNVNLTTSPAAGGTAGANAGDVIFVAGADIDMGGSAIALASTTPSTVSETFNLSASVSGPSESGGIISLTGLNTLSTSGVAASISGAPSNGGNVTLVAMQAEGGSSSGGTIALPSSSFTITTGGMFTDSTAPPVGTPATATFVKNDVASTTWESYSGSATNGNVIILAGASSGTSIVAGSIDTVGSPFYDSGSQTYATTTQSIGGGSIEIQTAQVGSDSLPWSYNLTNIATTQSSSFTAGTVQAASASVANLNAAGAFTTSSPGLPLPTTIIVKAGQNLTVGSVSNLNNTIYYNIYEIPTVGSPTSKILVDMPSSKISLTAGAKMNLVGDTTISSNAISTAAATGNGYTGVTGGTIALTAQSFSIVSGAQSKTVHIEAKGANGFSTIDNTGGDGGSISIDTTSGTGSAATVNIGNPKSLSSGNFKIRADGDTPGGNGGQLNVSSGGSINLDTSYLKLNPQVGANSNPEVATPSRISNGTGATIILNASNADTGTHNSGCVYILGTLDASGAASQYASGSGNPGGDGGIIKITTNSSLSFNIGGASSGTPNGVQANGSPGCNGCLTANGNNVDPGTSGATDAYGSGGSITVTNLGGPIDVGNNGSNSNGTGATASIEVQASDAEGSYFAADGGRITLQANGYVLSQGGLDASGGNPSTSAPSGNGGSIEISSNSTALFEVGTPGTAQTNGVIGTATAYGFIPGATAPTTLPTQPLVDTYGNGGSITLSNVGSGGIQIDTVSGNAAIAVTAAAANPQLKLPGADGGNIRLYAPNGPVFVNTSLDASGGSAALVQSTFNTTPVTVTGGQGGAGTPVNSTDTAITVADITGYLNGQQIFIQGIETGTGAQYALLTISSPPSGNTINLAAQVGVHLDTNITLSSPNFPLGTALPGPPAGTPTGTNNLTVQDSSGYHATQTLWLSGSYAGPGSVGTPQQEGKVISSISGNQINFTGNIVNFYNGNTTTLNAYYVSGNGGKISITSNGTTNAFAVGSGTTSNGVNGNLTANGYSGGTIELISNSSGGISIANSALSAQPTNTQTVFNGILIIGGNGGTLALNAPFGPVSVAGSLNVSGMSGGTNGTFGVGTGGNGGTVFITSNTSDSTPFTVGGGSIVANGVQNSINADGGQGNNANGSGGIVTLVNLGTDGIQIGTNTTVCNGCLTVNAPATGVNSGINPIPGNGGALSLLSPRGPFTLFFSSSNGPGLNANAPGNQSGAGGYHAGGFGGTITIVANNDSTNNPLSLVDQELSATGWSGGSITVVNNGNDGISVGTGTPIKVQAENHLIGGSNNVLIAGGPGGNISLQAPNGPVTIAGTLSANGGHGSSTVAVATGGNNSGTPPGYGPFTISGLNFATGTFYVGERVLISGTVSSSPVQEVQIVDSTDNSSQITVFALNNNYDSNSINIAGLVPAGDGGQISILQKTNQAFAIGGGGGSLSAAAGTVGFGGNGGKISIINLGSGDINITDPSTSLVTTPSGATQATNGGTGGSIYLSALGGSSGNVFITGTTGNLSVDGGAAYPQDANNFQSAAGPGGIISIITNSSTTFTVGGGTANGVTGILSATGLSGGSIGVKNIGAGGITFDPANIDVTALGDPNNLVSGNGGNIDLEAPGNSGLILNNNGTLSANSNLSQSFTQGGTIVLNAQVINLNGNTLTLEAQGDVTGTDGIISVSQTSASANPLVVGGNLTISLNSGMDGGVILSSASGIQLTNTLMTSPTGFVTLSTSTTQTITGQGTAGTADVSSGTLTINLGTGSLGTAGTNFNTTIGTLAVTTQGGSIFLTNDSALAINSSSLGTGSLQLTNTGDVLVVGAVKTFGNINFQVTGDILIYSNVSTHGTLLFDCYQNGGNPNGQIAGGLLSAWGGITLNSGTNGISVSTSTGSLTVSANGDSVGTTVFIENTGSVQLNASGSSGVYNFALLNDLGSITTSGALVAVNSLVLDNQTASGLDSYSITLGGAVGSSTAIVSLRAAGSIIQTAAANVIQGNSITLSSQNGNLGTVAPVGIGGVASVGFTYTPLFINLTTGGTLAVNCIAETNSFSVVVPRGGQVNLTNNGSGAINLNGVLTAGDFQLTTNADITVNTETEILSLYGGVYLHNSGSSGNITINGDVTAGGGPAVIQNDFTSGTIAVGDNITISGRGRVYDYQGTSPGLQYTTGVALITGAFNPSVSQGSLPVTNITVNINGATVTTLPPTGSTVYFGTMTSNANPATINVNSGSISQYPSAVVLNGNSNSTITLGSGAVLTAQGTIQALSSLDLTQSTVVTALTNLSQNIPAAGVTLSGQTVTIKNSVSLTNLSGFSIPKTWTVTLENFSAANPVIVNVANTTTKGAVILGNVQFSSSPGFLQSEIDLLAELGLLGLFDSIGSHGALYVSAVPSNNNEVLKVAGTLTTDGSLSLNIGGRLGITKAATVTVPDTGLLSIATGSDNLGTSTKLPPGTIKLHGNISVGTASQFGTIIIDSSGSIIQSKGSLSAASITTQIGGTQFPGYPGSQLSLNSISATSLTMSAGSGPGNGTKPITSTIVYVPLAASSLGSLSYDVLDSPVYIKPNAALNLSGSGLGTVTVSSTTNVNLNGDLSCGSCNITTSGALTAGAYTVTAIDNAAQLILTGGSIAFDGTTIVPQPGAFVLNATGNINLENTSISVGQLGLNYFQGPLGLADVAARGSISITSTSGNIVVDSGTFLQSVGGNINLTASAGNISVSGAFEADGGNIRIFASGNISGSSPSFTANAFGTMATNAAGGGIEIGAGLTSSTNLAAALNLAPGTISVIPTQLQPDNSVQPLGRNTIINNVVGLAVPTGAIVQNGIYSNGIDLGTTSGSSQLSSIAPQPSFAAASLNLNGGAIVIDAVGTGTVLFDGSNFNTSAYNPIAYKQAVGPAIEVLHDPNSGISANCRVAHVLLPGKRKGVRSLTASGLADVDEQTLTAPERLASATLHVRRGRVVLNTLCPATINTPVATVKAKRGALLVVTVDSTGLRIIACSGPNDVSVSVDGRPIVVSPGSEVVISDHELSTKERLGCDGVGRRGFSAASLGAGRHLTTCDVSLTGLVASGGHMEALRCPTHVIERKLANQILKTAAALHVITQNRGPYQAGPPGTESFEDDDVFTPVSFGSREVLPD